MKIKKNSSPLYFACLLFAIINLHYSIPQSFAQSPNTWVQKASFPGAPRIAAVGFTIGTKGYVGTGQDSSTNLLSDFWEYDPAADSWSQRADFAGSARRNAVGFAIGAKGYVGTGFDGTNNVLDFWEYDPSSNTWNQKRSLGTSTTNPRRDAVSFTVNNFGYVATGYDGTVKYNKECWQFDGDTTWIKKADLGSTQFTENWRRWAVGFAIDTNGYVGCGYNYLQDWRKDFWRFNAGVNTWTQMADYGGTARSNAVGFSAQGKGFIGTGTDIYSRSDFWEYNPSTNTWVQVANYTAAIIGGVSFSINGSGYAGLGRDSLRYRNDLWQYTPDSTIGISDLPDPGNNIFVFPNPCADKLCVYKNSATYKIQSIVIRDQLGKAVYFTEARKGDQLEINTSGLSSGTYFLIVQMENKKVVRKFVKE